MYTADLLQLVKRHQLIFHADVDDIQNDLDYRFCWPADSAELCEKVSVCVDEVSACMASNRLQLNHAKTEVLTSTTTDPVCMVRSALAELACSQFLRSATSGSTSTLTYDHEDPRHRRWQSVLRGCTSDPERSAIYVTSCLADFGSCTDCQQGGLLQLGSRWYLWPAVRLQSVLNAAARLVFWARQSERIAPLLHELHWLRVPERVTFRLCVLAYRCLGTAPPYLAGSLLRTSDVDTRHRRLRSADTTTLVVPSTRRSTLGDRAWLPPAVICQKCTVATFRRELKTVFFGRRLIVLHRKKCCLPATTDCRRFCPFCFV